MKIDFFFVGLPGLEPGKAGPESAVLPLHHSPIVYGCKGTTSFDIRKTICKVFSDYFYTIKRTITKTARCSYKKKETSTAFVLASFA